MSEKLGYRKIRSGSPTWILVFTVSLFLMVLILDVLRERKRLIANHTGLKIHTENSVLTFFRLVDDSREMLERFLAYELKIAMAEFQDVYVQSRGNPSRIDFDSLKRRFAESIAFYLINNDGIVEFTTREADLGLDFRKDPYFFNQLQSIRLGDRFIEEPITPGETAAESRKLAYMSTPDHRFVLVVSKAYDEYRDNLEQLNSTTIANRLKKLNPSILTIRFFDDTLALEGDPISEQEKRDLKRALVKIWNRQQNIRINDSQRAVEKSYLFVHRSSGEGKVVNSRIIEIVYDEKQIQEKLETSIRFLLMVAAVTLTAAVALTRYISGKMVNPIRHLIENVENVATFPYPRQVSIPANNELKVLEQSINDMIARANSEIKKRETINNRIDRSNRDLESRIERRTAELHTIQKKLIENAHQAGMAQIATDTLHNVRNVLNSVYTSITFIKDKVRKNPTEDFSKVCQMIVSQDDNLKEFLRSDVKGSKLVEFLLELEKEFNSSYDALESDVYRLNEKIEMIARVIIAQQNYTGRQNRIELLNIGEVVEDALVLLPNLFSEHGLDLEKSIRSVPLIKGQKSKVLHTLVNLITNAVQATAGRPPGQKKITINLLEKNEHVFLEIADTGIGIAPENLEKIFDYGFTTKKDGFGFGLHSCASYLNEMGASISVESDGIGKGTLFQVRFPT